MKIKLLSRPVLSVKVLEGEINSFCSLHDVDRVEITATAVLLVATITYDIKKPVAPRRRSPSKPTAK